MASVAWKKIKSVGEAKAILRHNDSEKRIATKHHSNSEIDTSLTAQENITAVYGLSYEDACKRYDDRLEQLDENGNRNKRKDRVTCISLCVPTPEQLPEEQELKWFDDVINILTERFGADNVIEGYVHRDEKHEYKDVRSGEIKQSRSHLHLLFVPEREGQLNAKNIMTRTEMRKLNAAVDDMTKEKYNVYFLDGTQQRSLGNVESLKSRSRLLEIAEKEEQLQWRETALERRETKYRQKALDLDLNIVKHHQKEIDLEQRERDCRAKEEEQNRVAEEQKRLSAELQQRAEQQRAVSELLHRKERELKEKEDKLKKKAERLGLLETAQQRETRVQQEANVSKPQASKFDRFLNL